MKSISNIYVFKAFLLVILLFSTILELIIMFPSIAIFGGCAVGGNLNKTIQEQMQYHKRFSAIVWQISVKGGAYA